VDYLPLPIAMYSFRGVPCLDFCLDVFCVIETRTWMKPGEKNFDGYSFDLPRREEKGYTVQLKEEFLGYDYLPLTPKDLGAVFWQRIPLILLKELLEGGREPEGVTITAASDSGNTYKIQKFEGKLIYRISLPITCKV